MLLGRLATISRPNLHSFVQVKRRSIAMSNSSVDRVMVNADSVQLLDANCRTLDTWSGARSLCQRALVRGVPAIYHHVPRTSGASLSRSAIDNHFLHYHSCHRARRKVCLGVLQVLIDRGWWLTRQGQSDRPQVLRG